MIQVKQHKRGCSTVRSHKRNGKKGMVLLNGVWHKKQGGLLLPTKRKVAIKKKKFMGVTLSDSDYSKNPNFDKLSETMNPTEIALLHKGCYAKAMKHGVRHRNKKSKL